MDLGLKGRNAIVCASSKGLGFSCAGALAREGAHIVLNGRDETALNAAAARLGDKDVRTVVADLGTAEGRAAMFAACPEPDILVTNNGGPPPRAVEALSAADISRALDMNMRAPFEMMQAAAPGMAARGFGRIVNITSVSVLQPLADLEASSAARAALTALSVGLARKYAGQGVTINNILPGYFATDRLLSVFDGDAARGRQTASIPAGRFGDPAEFGELCAFLCGRSAGYITGQNILIDGGLFDRNF